MLMREDSQDRRDFSRCLLYVMAGVMDFEEVRSICRDSGLDARRLTLPSGAERFIIFVRKSGQVWDSFTYYGEEDFRLR